MADLVHLRANNMTTESVGPACGASGVAVPTEKLSEVTCQPCRLLGSLAVPQPSPPTTDLAAFRTMLQHAGVHHDEAAIWGESFGSAQRRTGTAATLVHSTKDPRVLGSKFTFDSTGRLVKVEGL